MRVWQDSEIMLRAFPGAFLAKPKHSFQVQVNGDRVCICGPKRTTETTYEFLVGFFREVQPGLWQYRTPIWALGGELLPKALEVEELQAVDDDNGFRYEMQSRVLTPNRKLRDFVVVERPFHDGFITYTKRQLIPRWAFEAELQGLRPKRNHWFSLRVW